MTELPEQLHVNFERAFNRHDLEAVVGFYEPEAVLITLRGPVQGTDAIRDAYRGFLAKRPTIHLQMLGVHRAGELAMLHGKWVVHRASAGAQLSEGRSTEIIRLQEDGRWLFVIDNPWTPVALTFGTGNGGTQR